MEFPNKGGPAPKERSKSNSYQVKVPELIIPENKQDEFKSYVDQHFYETNPSVFHIMLDGTLNRLDDIMKIDIMKNNDQIDINELSIEIATDINDGFNDIGSNINVENFERMYAYILHFDRSPSAMSIFPGIFGKNDNIGKYDKLEFSQKFARIKPYIVGNYNRIKKGKAIAVEKSKSKSKSDEGGPAGPAPKEKSKSKSSSDEEEDPNVPPKPPVKSDLKLWVKNPIIANSKVMVGSAAWKKFVKDGKLHPTEHNLYQCKNMSKTQSKCEKKEEKSEEASKAKVLNPKTGRFITKNGEIFKSLVKAGVFDMNGILLAPKPKIIARNCVNKETFTLFSNVEDSNDVPNEDFLQLPSGYCFSITELIGWLNSGAFTNKNPHEQSQKLFTKESLTLKQLQKSPVLVELLKNYFKMQEQNIGVESDIVKKHLDVLYKIGDTGRICYFDNVTSFEAKDSSTFAYSIMAISSLAETIENLPRDAKEIFYNLKANVSTVKQILDSANKGQECIHGVGKKLIEIFITKFTNLYKFDKDLKYNATKTNLYFIENPKNKQINMYNTETRLIMNTEHNYYKTQFKSILDKTDKKMLKYKNDMRNETDYKETCHNDADYSTLNTLDEWDELEPWRRFKTEDGYCFDLLFLIKIVTDQLNTNSMTNPSPKYPTNPFTNRRFTEKDLLKLRIQITNNYLKVAAPILKFLYNPEILWDFSHNTWSDSEYQKWKKKLIELYEKDMRYQREFDSYQNEELKLNCIWTEKTTPVSANERKVLSYLETINVALLRNLPSYITPNSYYFSNANSYTRGPYGSSLIQAYNDIQNVEVD